MKGDIGWNENPRSWLRSIKFLYDVLVSRNWHKTVAKLYQNVYICKILCSAVQYYCPVPPSVSRDQYTALSLEGVLVTWYRRIFYIYTSWYNFDTVLYQFLKTETSDRWLFGIDQLLRFSGFSLYPLFFLYSPFNTWMGIICNKKPIVEK